MAYRRNVTDKDQDTVETAENDSGIPIYVTRDGYGEKKVIPAYDLQGEETGGVPNDAVVSNNSRARLSIGSHNDKPYRFDSPGKA